MSARLLPPALPPGRPSYGSSTLWCLAASLDCLLSSLLALLLCRNLGAAGFVRWPSVRFGCAWRGFVPCKLRPPHPTRCHRCSWPSVFGGVRSAWVTECPRQCVPPRRWLSYRLTGATPTMRCAGRLCCPQSPTALRACSRLQLGRTGATLRFMFAVHPLAHLCWHRAQASAKAIPSAPSSLR